MKAPNLAAAKLPVVTVCTGSILLKNSFSVQRRSFSFMEMQPKIRVKHDVRPTEKD
jgi:hypothetical protein